MSQIIDQFIEGSLNSNQIHFSTHYQKRLMEREIDRVYIKNLILNEEPLDLYEANERDKFKIVYPSETPGYKLIIVVLTKPEHMLVMTVYEQKIR